MLKILALVKSYVDKTLDERIGSGGSIGGDGTVTITTDTTLTKSGVPADAKATGDKIKELSKIPSGGSSTSAIIDVLELPTDDIVEGSLYRKMYAKFVSSKEYLTDYGLMCYCVDGLPEIGKVITNTEMNFINAYYNTQDCIIYGYMDEDLATMFGVTEGWYDFDTLLSVADASFGGIITDISQDPCDGSMRLLLGYSLHTYKDGWKELPYAYENEPEFDIKWDGVIGDRFALDMTPLGYEHHFMVKISDEVIELEQLENVVRFDSYGNSLDFSDVDASIDTEIYPGAITIENGEIVVVYSAEDTSTALGLPNGYLTNGVYFLYREEFIEDDYTSSEFWITRLVAKPKVTKIDEKFLPRTESKNLPTPTYEDEGKFLQVVDGEATWVNIAMAEGGIF